MAVLVLDKRKNPLMPCSEKRARLLLSRKQAVVHRRLYPFTLRLKNRIGGTVQPLRLKLDPGSKVTGVGLVRESEVVAPATGELQRQAHVLMLAELQHRGQQIRDALTQRRAFRRRRRGMNLRYRAPRFVNRTKPDGWLSPSLRHRVDSMLSWVNRLCQASPVTALSVERVRFDTQLLQNPEISGVEYQQGTLAGYEVREYLLEKWGRQCAYCDAEDVPLEMEHIQAKTNGGSDRVVNLTLACRPCNQRKGDRDVREFLADKPETLKRILAQAKAPLKDAAAVNATRHALYRELCDTGLPVEASAGGRTKFNRSRFGIPKAHCLDAVCVGDVAAVEGWQQPVLGIKATGRGSYQRTRLTKFGFPRGYLTRRKQAYGFQTGDRVKATVPSGKKTGVHRGRVAIRASGSFNLQTPQGVIQGVSHRHCRIIQRGDGYGYSTLGSPGAAASAPVPLRPEGRGFSARI
jgi:5-methylcytosine-specific restriction endonuclease McrA